VYQLDSNAYKADDLHQALDLTMEWEDKIPIGVIYQKETGAYTDELAPLQSGPLFKHPYDPEKIRKAISAA
jgi:2-oxoglutarate ferredoxin oxidoreductase subunit beta